MFATFKTLSRIFAFLLAGIVIGIASPALANQESGSPDASPVRAPEITPAQIDDSLAIGGEEIDARKLSSRMSVQVHVNGQGPYKFVVDSGADTSVIGEKLAAKLGLPDAGSATLLGMTEIKQVDRVVVDELQLGPTRTTDLELPVLDERNIGGDGMIGLDALVEQRLMLDFDEKIITVDDPDEPIDLGPNVIVVTARLQRGQLILTEIFVGGKKVSAVIDTGTEVTIGNLAMRNQLIRRKPKDPKTVDIFGVTGAIATLEFAHIPQLKLGSIKIRNLPIAFADVPPFEVFGLADEPALLLGTDLMEQFRRVSLDFRERKVRFQLKKCQTQLAVIRTIRSGSRISSDNKNAC
jgi:predicted aspartyl protease